jgi:hypothetical protein
VKEDDGESVLDRAGIQDARFSSSPDTLKSFGRIQGRPHGAEDARHSSGCARDCLKELQVVHLHSRCHRIRKSAESRYCILSCILSSPASSILYAPLQVCIQHTHILDNGFISSEGAYMPFLIPSQSFFVYTISHLPMQNMQHFARNRKTTDDVIFYLRETNPLWSFRFL